MKLKIVTRLLLIASAFTVAADAALAQTADDDTANAITVVAPRSVTNRIERSVPSEAAAATISLRLFVLYSDLDLATPTGSSRLMTRIGGAARDACKYLDRLYPLDPDQECVSRAVASATPQAEAAIAAARK